MPPGDLGALLGRLQREATQVLAGSSEAVSSREDAETDRRFQLGYEACEKAMAELGFRELYDGTADQRLVLEFLIERHPAKLTIPEVAQALYAQPGVGLEGNAVERAICDLVGADLLHCRGRFVLPTRAALHFAGLEGE